MNPDARTNWAQNRPGTPPFDTACIAPWVTLEFDPAGLVYGCCSGHLYPLGRIGEQRLTEIWNGDRVQALRSAVRNWDLTVTCGACRWHLEHGRMDPVAAVYDQYPLANDHPSTPHMMLFALSNRCNLACIMCNGELSSTIRAAEGRAPMVSPYNDQFFEDLVPMLGGLRLAKFLGGEPFLAPEHRRIWDQMHDIGASPRIDVTTNGTVWTDTVEMVLDRFSTDISVSIDAATAETYEKIRQGAKFSQLVANVERFRASTSVSGTRFHVSFCLMEQNWHELGSFLLWADSMDTLSSINLVTDDGFALHELPTAALESIQRRWHAEDRAMSRECHLNLDVWQTQLTQLDSVLAERANAGTLQPRQSRPIPTDFFETRVAGPQEATPTQASRPITEELTSHLSAWSSGGEVAELQIDETGVVVAVVRPHLQLGVSSDSMVGKPIADLVEIIAAQVGLLPWAVDYDCDQDRITRVLALAAERPVRGVSARIVRTLEVGHPNGSSMLIAEDRFYDRPAQPVRITARPPGR